MPTTIPAKEIAKLTDQFWEIQHKLKTALESLGKTDEKCLCKKKPQKPIYLIEDVNDDLITFDGDEDLVIRKYCPTCGGYISA